MGVENPMKNTKKTFQYIFIALICSLSFMIYLQWFSSSKPVQFFHPQEDKLPKVLTSLPVIDIDGKKQSLEMKDSPYTVFIVEYADPKFNRESYPSVSMFHEIINKAGIRPVYLWKSIPNEEKESVKHIRSMVDPNHHDAKYLLDNRFLTLYQKELGLQISSSNRLVFAYNDKGELVYQNDSLYEDEIIAEMMMIPKTSGAPNDKDGGD